MLNLGVGAINPYYLNRVGVEPNGDPVVFNPDKARKINKQPIFIDFAPTTTPEQRKKLSEYIEFTPNSSIEFLEIIKFLMLSKAVKLLLIRLLKNGKPPNVEYIMILSSSL